jgi:TonB family protein
MFRQVLGYALLLILLVSACVSSGQPSLTTCRSDLPRDTRSLNEVLDSTSLISALSNSWNAQAGLTLVKVTYDSVGTYDTVTVVSQFMSDSEKDQVGGTIRTLLRHEEASADTVHLFLGDASGFGPRRIPGMRGCAPALSDREALQRRLVEEASALNLTRSATVRLYARVETDGSVGEVRIQESSSNSTADAAAVRVIRAARFRPGLIEGIPTTTWANFPVTFQVRPPPDI